MPTMPSISGKNHNPGYPRYYIRIGEIIVLFVLFILISCSKGNISFYNIVLNDFDSSSYFVALDIRSPSYKGRALIENNNLFNFLNKTKGYNKQQYISVMEKILARNRSLKIDDKDMLKWKFLKVKEIGSVLFNANAGVDGFIRYYFDGTVLKYGITNEERNAVINQLFYWSVPTKIGPLTGQLMLGNN